MSMSRGVKNGNMVVHYWRDRQSEILGFPWKPGLASTMNLSYAKPQQIKLNHNSAFDTDDAISLFRESQRCA